MNTACKIAKVDDVGKLSDGYHTFDDLYFQRLVLWQRICNDHPNLCWKTKRHDDGELCFGGDNFLIAMDTPQGTYSYHYPIEEWDRFKVKELYKAKPFDGHTSSYHILLSLMLKLCQLILLLTKQNITLIPNPQLNPKFL